MNKRFHIIILALILFLSSFPVYAEDNPSILDSSLDSIEQTTATPEIETEEKNALEDNTILSENVLYVNEGTGYKLIIDDQADLLSAEEISGLQDVMTPLTKYGHIGFVSINTNDVGSAGAFAEQYYHSHFFIESGSLFLIDMDTREIYIFSDGANYETITSSKAYSITDNTYRYASDEEYFQCAKQSFQQIYTLLEGGKIAEPMRLASNVVISLIIAFFTSFLFVFFKSKIKKASDEEIIKSCNIDFKLGEVTAEKTGTHKEYSPVESSSGGGSSGGGGGGGSSGGGGGHSF